MRQALSVAWADAAPVIAARSVPDNAHGLVMLRGQ
jgi:hypothetical protein